ncbi:MAG: hypothetical protein ACRDFC_06745, partial [Ignavibacteria bacterium]
SEGEILDDIFFNKGIINFGKDLNYNQTVNINPKFNIPGLKKFIDLTASYRVQYGWQASSQNTSLGSNVGYSSDLQTSAFIKINQIIELFKPNKLQGGAKSLYQDDDKQSLGNLFKFLGTFIPNQINLTFSQSKSLFNQAVSGRPGFGNFWMVFNARENLGPSRLYQLGWITDPGKRVPNVSGLQDRATLNNSVNLSTFINPIFPDNLKISFTYKTNWSSNKNLNYITNSFGILGSPTSVLESRTITRPSFFISGDIVDKLAEPDPALSNSEKAKEISNSFENNFVNFPFPSWNLTLSGVEKFELFTGFANSVSIESGYSSDYKKTYTYNGIVPEYIQLQGITSGFTPLVGLNISFKPIEGGNLTASLKISQTDNYDLNPIDARINNTSTSDISVNASYSKTGFRIPLFGLSLQNDLTIAFSYTRTANDPKLYDYQNGIWNSSIQNGSISTSINPSIQYALSKSVTLQLFYKYTKTEPTKGNIQIPTRKSNEAGLNIKLSIQ